MLIQTKLPGSKEHDTCRTIPLCGKCFKLISLMYCSRKPKTRSEHLSSRPTQQFLPPSHSHHHWEKIVYILLKQFLYSKESCLCYGYFLWAVTLFLYKIVVAIRTGYCTSSFKTMREFSSVQPHAYVGVGFL